MKSVLQVAFAGNPNSGKTTLFNLLTGLNQKVANYPGVTVDKKTGRCILENPVTKAKVECEIADLPGSYSLYPKAPDEKIPFEVLCDPANESHPDVVVMVVDASNLKRSLYFSSQVIDLKIPTVIALNMMDLVQTRKSTIDVTLLSERMGVPVIPVSGLKKQGMDELRSAILMANQGSVSDFINIHDYSPCVLSGIREVVKTNSNYASFQIANNLEYIQFFHIDQEKRKRIDELIKDFGFDREALQTKETLERYRVINEIVKDCVVTSSEDNSLKKTRAIDNVITHPFFGPVIFAGILFLIFQAVFSWSSIPMDYLEAVFSYLAITGREVLPPGVFTDLLIDGILAGLGGVIIFIPQIASLFLFIGLLEDTGYMARVSFMMDRLLRPFGLSGKSVIPLAGGVACAIPAIMSARTIQGEKERLLTILVTPLMSCSARIPVYTLLISMVIPAHFVFGLLNLQALVLMGLYLSGFLAAIFASYILNKIIRRKGLGYFILEMPEYRVPRWRNLILNILEKVKIFVKDAGKIIIAISIVLWFLSAFGPSSSMENQTTFPISKSSNLENSFAGKLGKGMEPLIEPLGFNWKIGIALLTSFAAREVFVGTMATIYSVGETDDPESTIREKMLADVNTETGLPVFTLATGLSLMVFYAFALQCMSTLAVVYRESGNWKIPLFQFILFGMIAWTFSFLTFRIFR